jgi:hypothetical protein
MFNGLRISCRRGSWRHWLVLRTFFFFSCFIQTHGGYHASAFGKSKKGRFSVAYGYLERLEHPASTGRVLLEIIGICFKERCPSHIAVFHEVSHSCRGKYRKRFAVCGKHLTCISPPVGPVGVGGVRGTKRSIIPLSNCYGENWRASDTYLFPMS